MVTDIAPVANLRNLKLQDGIYVDLEGERSSGAEAPERRQNNARREALTRGHGSKTGARGRD